MLLCHMLPSIGKFKKKKILDIKSSACFDIFSQVATLSFSLRGKQLGFLGEFVSAFLLGKMDFQVRNIMIEP